MPSASDQSSGLGPQKVYYSYCTKCNATLPDSIGIGDKCPSCGVRFNAKMDEHGKITASKPVLVGTLIKMAAVACAVVALVVFVAKLSGS